MEGEHESGLPDLPSDLLGLVLRRLPSLVDRIRLGAVCRRIRSSIRLLPPSPQLPWIVLHDGTLFELSSNVPVCQLPLPGDASCYSACENMLFLLHNDGRCFLMNALSGHMTRLLELAAVLRKYNKLEYNLRKVVTSKALPDHGPIIALLVGHQLILSTCRPAGGTNSCMKAMVAASIDDIAFFQGRLYAVCADRLIAFELNSGRLGKPTSTAGVTVVNGLNYKLNNVERYLVESNGKLLVAMLWTEYIYSDDDEELETRKCGCKVWEADMTDRRWKKVDGGLDGQALLVSSPCSMSVLAAADDLDAAREDCIYFLHRLNYLWGLGSGVYNMRTKTFAPLPREFTPLLQELTPPVELEFGRSLIRPKTKSVMFPAWFYPN